MTELGYPDVHEEHRAKPSLLAHRVAAALLDGRLKPAALGLGEVELRFNGRGRVVERVSAYGEFCPLVVQRVTDQDVGREAPHCPHLSGLSENSVVLHSVGGRYAAAAEPTSRPAEFTDLDAEPDLLIRAALALDHVETTRAAARASAQLDRLSGPSDPPPELSL